MELAVRNTILIALGALALAGCGAAPAPSTAASVAIEPVRFTGQCPADDFMNACASETSGAAAEFQRALAGDYQAQRNVSYAHTSTRPWNVQQPVQGCAWRMVIMVTRPADSTMDDAGMYRIQCGALSAEDQTDARAVAQLIHRQVKGSDLPTPPPIAA